MKTHESSASISLATWSTSSSWMAVTHPDCSSKSLTTRPLVETMGKGNAGAQGRKKGKTGTTGTLQRGMDLSMRASHWEGTHEDKGLGLAGQRADLLTTPQRQLAAWPQLPPPGRRHCHPPLLPL